jgi:hypothetical protein
VVASGLPDDSLGPGLHLRELGFGSPAPSLAKRSQVGLSFLLIVTRVRAGEEAGAACGLHCLYGQSKRQ